MFTNSKEPGPDFRNAVRRRHIDQAKLARSFDQTPLDEAVAALEELIAEKPGRYNKVAEALETISVTDGKAENKWRKVQERINEEVFGILDWQVILDELDQAVVQEKEILSQAEKERRVIRKKLPTSVVVGSPVKAEAPLVIKGGSEPVEEKPFDLVPDDSEEDIAPEPKKSLVERIENLARKKRQQLREIQERKKSIIEAHGEKLLRKTQEEAEEKKAKLEAFRKKFKGAYDEPADARGGEAGHETIEEKLAAIETEKEQRFNATRAALDLSLGSLAAREKAVQALFDDQIERTRSNFTMIEDSGLFQIPDEVRLGFDLEDQKRAIDYLEKNEAVLSADSEIPSEELTRIRTSILLIWDKHDDAGLRSKAVRALEKLIFSNLADPSKARLISLLVQGLATSAQKEAAAALEEVVSRKALYFRLSTADAETIVRAMSSRAVPVRMAAILVAAKQLFLESNGRIPRYPRELSSRMLGALLAAMKDPANQGVFKRLEELGYVQTGAA